MKNWFMGSVVYSLLVMLAVTGCEWTASEDGDSWDDSNSWADFTGTYRPGAAVIISTNGTPTTSTDSNLLSQSTDETLDVGNGNDKSFAGSLRNKPILRGSISITDGTEQFEDGDKDGDLTGSEGGTGAINYETGAYNVTFKLQPDAGTEINATYLYYVNAPGGSSGGGGGGTSSGSKRITRLMVRQEGNVLTLVDNDGAVYNGKMGRLNTTGGGTGGAASGTAVASFEAEGAANGIKIYGTFEGAYTAPTEDTLGGRGTLTGRVMHGTWVKGKESGSFDMSAGN